MTDYQLFVEEAPDRQNRYMLADQARKWLANEILKLTQLYEVVLIGIPQRIEVVSRSLFKLRNGPEVLFQG